MPRRQVNIGFKPEDYEELLAAASEAGTDVTGFVREAALCAMRSSGNVISPVPPYDPMDLIRVGYVLAEAQHAGRPRWWQFWRRGQEQSDLGLQGLTDEPEPVAIEGGVVQHATG